MLQQVNVKAATKCCHGQLPGRSRARDDHGRLGMASFALNTKSVNALPSLSHAIPAGGHCRELDAAQFLGRFPAHWTRCRRSEFDQTQLQHLVTCMDQEAQGLVDECGCARLHEKLIVQRLA